MQRLNSEFCYVCLCETCIFVMLWPSYNIQLDSCRDTDDYATLAKSLTIKKSTSDNLLFKSHCQKTYLRTYAPGKDSLELNRSLHWAKFG